MGCIVGNGKGLGFFEWWGEIEIERDMERYKEIEIERDIERLRD